MNEMTALAGACSDLAAWLPHAAALLAEPDTAPAPGRSRPHSAPPWNPAAADALYAAHAGIRDVEQELLHAATGRPAPECRRESWSDGNTLAALTAIPALAEAAPDLEAGAASRLSQWIEAIMLLPAVDLGERILAVRSACPYCGLGMLRVVMTGGRAGRVTCLRYGACTDGDGEHPRGEICQSGVDGLHRIFWHDGSVT